MTHIIPRRAGTARRSSARAFTILDALLIIASALILLAIVAPTLAGARRSADVQTSLDNLVTLGAAHAIYAADWNGRQVSVIVDDISSYGPGAADAINNYAAVNDLPHPPLVLGWGFSEDGEQFGVWTFKMRPPYTGNYTYCQPIVFDYTNGFSSFGSFRMMNTRPLHGYLSGRYYDPVFYPPGDVIPHEVVSPAYDVPSEWVPGLDVSEEDGDIPAWAGYCPSPAASFHPDVMRHPDAGGWQDPWSIDHGFEAPGFYQALYPALKTQMIEHHWIQNAPPEPCNPAYEHGTFADCEPWYFNHGYDSAPAALFYDMSVRLLPNAEVLAADEQLIAETGYGLWSRDTPFGAGGYRGEYAYDGIRLSHHVLTTDGIRGRDTLADPGGLTSIAGGGRDRAPTATGTRPFPRRIWERRQPSPPADPGTKNERDRVRMSIVDP